MKESGQTSQNELVLYSNEDQQSLGFIFDGKTIWGSKERIAELFHIDPTGVGKHIRNIYDEGEQDEKRTTAKFAGVVENRPNYRLDHYNLKVIIAVGMRVRQSEVATRFRQWANDVIEDRMLSPLPAITPKTAYDQLRVNTHRRLARHIAQRNKLARDMGVKRVGLLNNAHYQGLYKTPYGALKAQRGIADERMIDRMGPDELTVNDFCATLQTGKLQQLLDEGKLVGEIAAITSNFSVSREIRSTIERVGGDLPENYPLEPDHIKDARRRLRPKGKKQVGGTQLPLFQ